MFRRLVPQLQKNQTLAIVSDHKTGLFAASHLAWRVCFTYSEEIWSGWDGVGTAAVTLVGPIAYFTRVCLRTYAHRKLRNVRVFASVLPLYRSPVDCDLSVELRSGDHAIPFLSSHEAPSPITMIETRNPQNHDEFSSTPDSKNHVAILDHVAPRRLCRA